MQAVMSFSFEGRCRVWVSSVSGAARLTCVVNSASPSVTCRRQRLLVLGDDHDGGKADGHARVLVGRSLYAACDHQPHVHAVGHVIGTEGRVDRLG